MGRKPEGSAEKLFKQLGKKIDGVLEDIKKVAKEKEYTDRIEELKRNGEQLKREFDNFKESHKDTFDKMEDAIENIGKEVREAFDKTFKKDHKTKKEA